MSRVRLGVNIDHIATLREARGTDYPDPVQAAVIAEQAGADGITLHLREDRRHIQDADVVQIKAAISKPMNLEMATTDEMLKIATDLRPENCCIVPERREELTTEGGLDVCGQEPKIATISAELARAGIEVSLFIDPEIRQIEAAVAVGSPTVEIHTGGYADARNEELQSGELQRIETAVEHALKLGLKVNAGHGLHYKNVLPIARIRGLYELNIGHAIIAQAAFDGLAEAVRAMKGLLDSAT